MRELLFLRPDGSPMQFHLDQMLKEDFEKLSTLIEDNGGKVESQPSPNVLTFTFGNSENPFVFDAKFITDCINDKKILNVDKYFIGDGRAYGGCPMSKIINGSKTCVLNQQNLTSPCEIRIEPKTAKQKTTWPIYDKSATKVRKTVTKEVVETRPKDKLKKQSTQITKSGGNTESEDESESVKWFQTRRNRPLMSSNDEDSIQECSTSEAGAEQKRPLSISHYRAFFNKPSTKTWIENVIEKKSKDKDGFPKLDCRYYSAWETRNIILAVIKSKAYDKLNSEAFWEIVSKSKLLPKCRNYKSIHKHMIARILPKIKEFKLKPEEEQTFIEAHEELKKKREQRLNDLKKKSNKN